MRQTRKAAPSVEWTAASTVRLDSFIASHKELKSRTKAKRFIESKLVKVNGKITTKPALILQSGDCVLLQMPQPILKENSPTGSRVLLDILYEDASCMVIDKPAGLTVHPGVGTQGQATLLSSLQPLFAKRRLPFSSSEVLVHRLDRETTGCLLVAKNARAHLALQKQFQDRTAQKEYLALVCGTPAHPKAMIDSPIGRHTTERTKMSVGRRSRSREAQTIYEVLGSSQGASLLQCELKTGRTHQVRVHVASIGHPVLGDRKYALPFSQKLTQKLKIDFLCLHARKLGFVSPDRGPVSVVSPLPARFEQLLKRLEIKLK